MQKYWTTEPAYVDKPTKAFGEVFLNQPNRSFATAEQSRWGSSVYLSSGANADLLGNVRNGRRSGCMHQALRGPSIRLLAQLGCP